MTEDEARSLVTSTGRQLLKDGLVVRTWGNISCRLDQDSFLITPSGLDYMQTKDEDLAVYHLSSGKWEGPHKPSSEKGIHASAYELFADAGFVIHTHQAYASAISVYGFSRMEMTAKEKERLGGIALAEYGLPGTKILKNNVRKAMENGARTILLASHGALLIGSDKEDAYEKAQLLEHICRRNWLGLKYTCGIEADIKKPWQEKMLANLHESYPNAAWVQTKAVIARSRSTTPLPAQLDDMSQMIGRHLTVVSAHDPCTLEEKVYEALESKDAVLVRGFGAIVNGVDEDDTVALAALVDKACITALHTRAAKVKKQLSLPDCILMHAVYQRKYSKLK